MQRTEMVEDFDAICLNSEKASIPHPVDNGKEFGPMKAQRWRI